MQQFVGLMSGTSLDGVDGVLVAFDDQTQTPAIAMRTLAHVHHPFEPLLRAELLALQQPGPNEIHRAALAANGVAKAYAKVVADLLAQTATTPAAITAVGAHGQTVRHAPSEHDGTGYTVQLLNGALLAELCGIDVVCDFRSRDVAAGGQGAPLVPAFHAAAFGHNTSTRAVLNLGGMANISVLHPARDAALGAGDVTGFDTGPGGALLDSWCTRHRGQPFDAGGQWAQSGRVNQPLLQRLLAEPYFARLPPKSTGRDTFNAAWLDAALATLSHPVEAADVQATLSELTATSVVQALQAHAQGMQELIVCGGGARNTGLLARLSRLAPGLTVRTSEHYGIAVDQVEAVAFAWLAARFTQRLPGNVAGVTGALGPRVLGVLHPAAVGC